METNPVGSSFAETLQEIWQWTVSHKRKTFVALLGVFILAELLSIPWFDVGHLKAENPRETALMRQRVREAEGDDKQLVISQRWIPLSRVPRYVINAVVVAEDGTFWEHNGFDWYEFQQAVQKDWEKKRAVRGASTITQQLAKNLYLSTSKDPIRKLKEWAITALLERELDKNRIIELYLNTIEWGHGIFGIEAAAHTYFGCSASSLSYEQALRLAAVIPSPLKHRPTDNSRWVTFRKNIVAQRMLGREYDVTEEPEEDDDNQQQKETTPNQPPVKPLPEDTGNVPAGDSLRQRTSIRRDAMPNDSTDIEKGDTNDLQRRKQAD